MRQTKLDIIVSDLSSRGIRGVVSPLFTNGRNPVRNIYIFYGKEWERITDNPNIKTYKGSKVYYYKDFQPQE